MLRQTPPLHPPRACALAVPMNAVSYVSFPWCTGQGVVKTGRKMLGETKPSESAPGTIRGDFCVDIGR